MLCDLLINYDRFTFSSLSGCWQINRKLCVKVVKTNLPVSLVECSRLGENNQSEMRPKLTNTISLLVVNRIFIFILLRFLIALHDEHSLIVSWFMLQFLIKKLIKVEKFSSLFALDFFLCLVNSFASLVARWVWEFARRTTNKKRHVIVVFCATEKSASEEMFSRNSHASCSQNYEQKFNNGEMIEKQQRKHHAAIIDNGSI